jgi:hypothetical protein
MKASATDWAIAMPVKEPYLRPGTSIPQAVRKECSHDCVPDAGAGFDGGDEDGAEGAAESGEESGLPSE